MRASLLVFAIAGLLSSAAFAQEPQATRFVIDEFGHVTTSAQSAGSSLRMLAAAAPTTDFSMPPSVTSTTLRRLNSQRQFIYLCADSNQQPVTCTIGISLQARAFSGGHDHHDANRPQGSLSASSGNTNGSVGFATVFTAPEVSGVIELRVTLVFPPVVPNTTGQTVSFTQTIAVEIPDLESLPPGNWHPTGMVTGQHTDNHYGTVRMNESVLLMADEYRATFGALLDINDMSLVQGGLFDVYGSNLARIWLPDHFSHRWGDDVDVGLPPRARRLALLRSAGYFDLRRIVEGGRLTHYHFRLH